MPHSIPIGDALAGCLLGQALGDALGFVVEAQSPDSAAQYVSDLRAGRTPSYSHSEFPFGQYSDDTQLARELLCAMRDAGGWEPAAFARRVAALFADGREVGAGPGTRAAAQRLQSGVSWRESGTPAPYDGNGSAMRAAPIGVVFREHSRRMVRAAREQSLITHGHPRCTAGSIAVAGAACLAARATPIHPGEFVDRLARWIARDDRAFADAVRSLPSWLALPPDAAARRLHQSGLDPASAGGWRGISASVVPSVAWSLYAFLRSPEDYRETVCTAIEVGGDTDTMAGIAGAISGARLGMAALPRTWLDRVTDRGEWGAAALEQLARDCAALAGQFGAGER